MKGLDMCLYQVDQTGNGDCFFVVAESMEKALKVGKRYFKKRWGEDFVASVKFIARVDKICKKVYLEGAYI